MRSLCFIMGFKKHWPNFLSTEGDKNDKKVQEEVHE